MQTLRKRTPDRNWNVTACPLAALFASAAVGLLAGCASPGAPLPPSLKLPQPVADLTAIRTGNQVLLHWTTPARTTDRLLLSGSVTAEICREAATPATPARPAPNAARPGTVPCNAAVRVPVSPGPTDAADDLPAPLTSGAPAALAYRVFLVNSAGRTAGPSAVVYAASGEAPPPVTGLRATSTKPGVVLEWAHAAQASQSGDTVELQRTLQPQANSPDGNQPARGARPSPRRSSIPLGDSTQPDSHFRARDTGGAIDRTAQPGMSYRYTVQRVRQAQVSGRTLELRGEASQPVEVATGSAFPPDTPAGLVAAPAYTASGKLAIDLSWEPAVELHVAGYKVYRRQGSSARGQEGQAWQLLTAQPMRVAAYTDATVAAGEVYAWRVTAVSDSGLESQSSAEVSATVPAR